jgi:head-tail adaptor
LKKKKKKKKDISAPMATDTPEAEDVENETDDEGEMLNQQETGWARLEEESSTSDSGDDQVQAQSESRNEIQYVRNF